MGHPFVVPMLTLHKSGLSDSANEYVALKTGDPVEDIDIAIVAVRHVLVNERDSKWVNV